MKAIISMIVAFCLINMANSQNNKNRAYYLLIGTYTISSKSDGIYVYNFNSQTGDLNLQSKVAGEENPSYLDISRDGKKVYCVNEVRDGQISAFDFNTSSGELLFLNRVSSGGSGPCYVTVDDDNKFLYVGNYNSGSLSAIALKTDGSLATDNQNIQHTGSSINKSRQAGPHVHATVLSPDGRYLYTPDLGTDLVNIYQVDAAKISRPLVPADPAQVTVEAGSGPRHLTFHPNSKFAYLIHEMAGLISAYEYDDGKLTEIQTITMLSPDFKGRTGAADIHVSPDGQFLYGSNRGDANEIVIYAIEKNGNLKYAGRQKTLGDSPRNFVIDPSGNFLLVANQNSNEVIIFNRDQKSGLLTPSGKSIQVSKPVCLKFIKTN